MRVLTYGRVTLSVRQLTEIPYLRTRFHAGESGGDRVITWAHSIEYPRPWEWLEEGQLMMTVGLGIPSGESAQVEFVEALSRVKLAGVAIGENMQAPPLSEAMVRAADEHGLPLLWTAFEVPFIQLSRAVGGASHSLEHRRLVDAARIYDRIRADLARGASPAESLSGLAGELDCELWVLANQSGLPIFPGTVAPPSAVRQLFLDAVRERGGVLPGIMHLEADGAPAAVVPVPARRPVSLLAFTRRGGDPPAYSLLQHAATVVALEVERQWAGIEEQRRLGSETLAALIDGRIGPMAAARQMRLHGLEDGSHVLLTMARDDEPTGGLHHVLAERELANMLLRRNDILYCLLAADDQGVDAVIDVLARDARVGVSASFEEPDQAAAAAREARWALGEARRTAAQVVRYGDQPPSLLGARSVSEAQVLVDNVLGPVLDYDEQHGTELVNSLAVFLACNRSWQRASAQLFVHRQTLVYRMQRIEQLTGRQLSDTSAVVELWLAVQARELLTG